MERELCSCGHAACLKVLRDIIGEARPLLQMRKKSDSAEILSFLEKQISKLENDRVHYARALLQFHKERQINSTGAPLKRSLPDPVPLQQSKKKKKKSKSL